MREIKFRAWSLGNKLKGIEPHYIEDFAIDAFYGTPKDIFDGNRSEDGIECIEQYTGLKDKNGREIYEGDICSLIYSEIKDGRKRWKKINEDIELVEFGEGYFKFSNTDKDGIGSELSFSDYGDWATADGQYKYEAIVIGNIHENPELLGSKK